MKHEQTRILFMGTPDFSVPSLLTLLDEGYDVVGVVTQPDRPKGRKRTLTPPPVKSAAIARGLPVFQPEKVRSSDAIEHIRALQPDLIVTAAYGQILPKAILELPQHRCINVHASLLPKYRGGAPIHRAIIDGQSVTGVTIMYMEEGLDTGDMISKVEVEIGEEDTTGSLHDKLSIAGAALLRDTLPDLLAGKLKAVKQEEREATYAPNISREDERIDWNAPSRDIHNRVRGLHPWPVAYTTLHGEVFKVWATKLSETAGNGGSVETDHRETGRIPGTVLACGNSGIEVATQDGSIWLTEVQPAGKRSMPASEFVKGGRLSVGEVLGGG